jgi:phosphoribosylglycinamide formyltransferase-1
MASRRCKERHVELVLLAGFMRRLHGTLLAPFAGRMLNIHPSLLPAFPGPDAIGQRVRAGVRVTRCTVHCGSASRCGPILAQAGAESPGETQADRSKRACTRRARALSADRAPLPHRAVAVDGTRVRFGEGRGRTADAETAHG